MQYSAEGYESVQVDNSEKTKTERELNADP